MKKYLLIIAGIIIGIIGTSYAAYKLKAEQVSFDNSSTGLNSNDVQAAVDEIGSLAAVKISDINQRISDLENKIEELEEKKVVSGTVISYILGTTVPDGYLACDGKTYNISDYKELAEAIKKAYGKYNYWGGDGITTFAVPNLQGEFLRGYSASSQTSKTNGVKTAGVGLHQDGTQIPYYRTFFASDTNKAIFVQTYDGVKSNDPTNVDYYLNKTLYFKDTYIDEPTGSRSDTLSYLARPTNTSVLYCIKY